VTGGVVSSGPRRMELVDVRSNPASGSFFERKKTIIYLVNTGKVIYAFVHKQPVFMCVK
jgi:hypothetical protein